MVGVMAACAQIENFKIFNRSHGKFRVSIINQCNMVMRVLPPALQSPAMLC